MPRPTLSSRLTYARRRQPARQAFLREIWQKPRSLRWASEVLFAGLDLCYVTDLYEAAATFFAPAARPLSTRERALLYPYFGDTLPWDLILIDERAWAGPRFGRFCYVSFHTINSWGPMGDHTLVHEVVHVWQYTHRGAAYIPRALYAQTTELGYNYGGLTPLRNGLRLEDFNYEQQADIIEDAFRLANGYQAQWVPGRGAEILPFYQPYLAEVRAATFTPC
ncbi:hypothetical protein [Neolewinella antarctica]|uniref:Uncharacterized protein n=1 Tax=Neolewinella antarctica TaxID=442734 RepID=A0ABX0XH99_9BACT|nr:hypothetical protein [Neolewinella antarctica]NJC28127.1 hypothetical protein [Neolewinella antarctica]